MKTLRKFTYVMIFGVLLLFAALIYYDNHFLTIKDAREGGSTVLKINLPHKFFINQHNAISAQINKGRCDPFAGCQHTIMQIDFNTYFNKVYGKCWVGCPRDINAYILRKSSKSIEPGLLFKVSGVKKIDNNFFYEVQVFNSRFPTTIYVKFFKTGYLEITKLVLWGEISDKETEHLFDLMKISDNDNGGNGSGGNGSDPI